LGSDTARKVGKERTCVSHATMLPKLRLKVRAAVRQHTIQREHALAPLRLEPEQPIAARATRDMVRGLLGEELMRRLVPIRIEPSVYDKLIPIAPEGDVSKLLKRAVEKLCSEMNPSTIESFTL